jgi:hypothetical protein
MISLSLMIAEKLSYTLNGSFNLEEMSLYLVLGSCICVTSLFVLVRSGEAATTSMFFSRHYAAIESTTGTK